LHLKFFLVRFQPCYAFVNPPVQLRYVLLLFSYAGTLSRECSIGNVIIYMHYKSPIMPASRSLYLVKRVQVIRSTSELSKHRNLIPYFREIARQAAEQEVIDPLSAAILDGVSVLSLVPSVLLAVFLCRFVELRLLSLDSISRTTYIQIHQLKTKTSKRMSSKLFKENLSGSIRGYKASLCVVPYVRLAKDIRASARKAGITLPDRSKSETHIFRHLYASWAQWKKYDRKITAKRLGHLGLAALSAYEHPWASLTSHISK